MLIHKIQSTWNDLKNELKLNCMGINEIYGEENEWKMNVFENVSNVNFDQYNSIGGI